VESVVLLAIGLAVLLTGGHAVVEGASSAARGLGVSQLAVGLTAVAFGTSAPELAVNLTAVFEGDPAIAFGNVMGSNIANIGLILGLSAILGGLTIRSAVVTREVPILLLATVAALVMGLDPLLTGQTAEYDRVDGLILLTLFSVFLYGVIRSVMTGKSEGVPEVPHRLRPPHPRWALAGSAGIFLLGLGALTVGAELTVRGAEGVALSIGIPAAAVAVSIVAVGTSLPELVTSLVAVRQGNTDLVVGNIVGSNLFNLLFILGLTATLQPVPVPSGGGEDLVVMLLITSLFVGLLLTGRRRIRTGAGILLVLLWAGYIASRFLLFSGTGGVS
jgi:cation:H+ antiporter